MKKRLSKREQSIEASAAKRSSRPWIRDARARNPQASDDLTGVIFVRCEKESKTGGVKREAEVKKQQ